MSIPPLAGFTVAVTADRRREEQVELLRRRGADVVEAPTIRTEPLGDDDALRDAVEGIVTRPPQHTVLLTGLGVRTLLAAAESVGLGDRLLEAIRGSRVYARGPKANGAAVTAGIHVDWRTVGERSTEIVEVLTEAARRGERIAVQRDGDSRPWTAEALAELGADVVDVPVYRWTMPEDLQPALRLVDAICAGAVDAVTFTSSPALRHLFDLAEGRGQSADLRTALDGPVLAVAIGIVCAETSASLGIHRAVMPERNRLGAMVLALSAALSARARRVVVGGFEVTLQGSVARVGQQDVRLAERERAVLHALVDAGGAVVPKDALLRQVWGETPADGHTVEVTVARLRRRLGPAGEAVLTVPRRGYRLAV